MAYHSPLADRVRSCLPLIGLTTGEVIGETKMFGGLCFTLNGKMLVGIDKQARIVIRISTENYEKHSLDGKVTPMDFTGKPLRNFAFVPEASFRSEPELVAWIESSAQYVRDHMLGKPAKKRKIP